MVRKVELLLSVALLGSAATAFLLWGELRDERTRNAELSARATSLPTPIAAPVEATPVPAPASASPAAATPDASFATAPSPRVEPSGQEDAEAHRRRLQQPQYREAWRAQRRLNYALRRENVIRLLGFTPEEAEAVVEIAIDRQLSWIDRQPKAITQELYEQDRREDQAKLRELLGEEKHARFQEYMESRSTRVQVDQLRPQFTGEDTLRDDQVEPLIAALHVERTRLQTEQQEYRTSAPLGRRAKRRSDTVSASWSC